MDIRFYMFAKSAREVGFARLAGQVAGMGKTISVICSNQEKAEALSEALWQHHEFLPHEIGERHVLSPITIGVTPQSSDIVFVMDDVALPDVSAERICLLFHAADVDVVASRRQDWKTLSAGNTEISYWAEQGDGKWVKQAEANAPN